MKPTTKQMIEGLKKAGYKEAKPYMKGFIQLVKQGSGESKTTINISSNH